MRLEAAIRKRHSIRRYSHNSVKWDKIVRILDAARLAPSAGNLCTLRIILVSDKGIINEIASAAKQDFIAYAPAVIVACSDPSITLNAYGIRGYRYARQQAGAAIQNMLLEITDLGLASCWVGAFNDSTMKKILGIPDDVEIEAILPVAHKSIIREIPRNKISLNSILFFDRYGRKQRFYEKMAR
ncbi:MAG: nitroreductase family protein [archaeon]